MLGSKLGRRDTVATRHVSCHLSATAYLQVPVLAQHILPRLVAVCSQPCPPLQEVPSLDHTQCQSALSCCSKLGHGWLCLRSSKRPAQFPVKLYYGYPQAGWGYLFRCEKGTRVLSCRVVTAFLDLHSPVPPPSKDDTEQTQGICLA